VVATAVAVAAAVVVAGDRDAVPVARAVPAVPGAPVLRAALVAGRVARAIATVAWNEGRHRGRSLRLVLAGW